MRKIGNSRGVILPGALIAACGLESEVDLRIEGRTIVIEAAGEPRAHWFDAFVAPLTGKGQALGCRPELVFQGKHARILLDRIRCHGSLPKDASAYYAYSMSISHGKRTAHTELVEHILEAPGRAAASLRRAAFDNKGLGAPLDTLIDKVAMQPARVTDEDLGAVKAVGLTEDQVFELVICAAVGQSSRQYTSALEALDQAMNEAGGRYAP
ncbi:MAG: hypothetical protein ACLQMF_18640 [Rectinemataceae bacterium]